MSREDVEYNTVFVKLIEQYPCLYDKDDANYSRREKCEAAWETIAKEMKESVTVCKQRWKNIRTVFSRHLNSQLFGSGKRRRYYLYDDLRFMIPHIGTRTHLTFLTNNNSDLVQEDDEIPIKIDEHQFEDESFTLKREIEESSINESEAGSSKSIQTIKQRPLFHQIPCFNSKHDTIDKCIMDLMKNENNNNNNRDPDEEFLHSLLPDVKAMDAKQKRKFKSKALQLIEEIMDS